MTEQPTIRKNLLIVIGGPTAIGKTSVAIQLAQHYQCDILSADSRQFYKEMTIGTAKPDAEELAAAPHHFINSLSIEEEYNVGCFEQDGLTKLEELFQEKNIAILVGGSGLYIRALCEGLDVFPDISEEIIQAVEADYKTKGITALQEELKSKDAAYFEEVDVANARRLMRALCVIRAVQKPFSEFRKQHLIPRSFECIYIALTTDRQVLYDRINLRVDKMMEAGLLEEVRTLYPYRYLKSLQTVGYQEFFPYIEGETDLEAAVELVKRNSRRYAKRQMTWFRNQQPKGSHWNYFAPNQLAEMIELIGGGGVG